VRAYLRVLAVPGALAFSSAGLLARFGSAMIGIGTVLMASALYGNYGIAGGLTAANAIAWAFGTAFLSNLVDRYGQRRIMLPAALVSAACLGALIVAALLHADLWSLFVLTIISGFTNGSPAAMVRARWNYVLTSSHDLHTAYSLESTLDEVSFIVGPVLATWLATSVHPTAGLIAPFIFGAGRALVFYSLSATQPAILPREAGPGRRARFLPTYPGFAPVLVVGLLMGSIFGSIDLTTVAATTAWDSRQLAGVVLGVFSGGSGLGGLLYGMRGWASPVWKRFVWGLVLVAITLSPLVFAKSFWALAVMGLVTGFTVAPTLINANSLIALLIPGNRLTEGLAWLGTSIGIGVSIGSTLAGHLVDTYGYRAGFAYGAGCGLLACLVALVSMGALRRISGTADAGVGASPTVE